MGEVLDMAKKKLGIVDPQNLQQQPLADKKKPTLQEAMETLDSDTAEGLLRSNALLRQAEIDARRRELDERNRATGGAAPMTTKDPNVEARQHITDQGVYLLKQGVDPKIVGQILQGSAATVGPNPVILSPSGGGQQGLTVADVMALLDRMEARKGGDGELTRITTALDRLTERLERMEGDDRSRYRAADPVDPVASVKQHIDLVKAMGESLEPFGYVKVGSQVAGESIENLKEKNRHAEELERLKTEAKYKETIGNTFAEIPERIGKGLSSQLMGEEEPSDTGGLPTYPCACGHKIVIPPGAPEAITCGKCGAIYSKGKEPPKQEKPEAAKKEAGV